MVGCTHYCLQPRGWEILCVLRVYQRLSPRNACVLAEPRVKWHLEFACLILRGFTFALSLTFYGSGWGMQGTLLLGTSDLHYAQRLQNRLQVCRIGCHITEARFISGALAVQPDLDAVLVDLDAVPDRLPQLQRLRASAGNRVLLTCSGKSDGTEAIVAYEAGADDYFEKSTDLVVVEAKVRRAISRRQLLSESQRISGIPAPAVTPRRELLARLDSELTRFEYRLLQLLADGTEDCVERPAILERLWGRPTANPKLLYEHVSTLRAKLLPRGWTIVNVRGRGYRLDSSDRVSAAPPPEAAAPSN